MRRPSFLLLFLFPPLEIDFSFGTISEISYISIISYYYFYNPFLLRETHLDCFEQSW